MNLRCAWASHTACIPHVLVPCYLGALRQCPYLGSEAASLSAKGSVSTVTLHLVTPTLNEHNSFVTVHAASNIREYI